MRNERRILHVLRAPVGGLFRHVRDLAIAQATRGHRVGVICDAIAGDPLTEQRLSALSSGLALGLHRVPMSRDVGPRDVAAYRAIRRIAAELQADILHGHGAKGGAYARLVAGSMKRSGQRTLAFYTPHGGSLHYHPSTLKGRFYMAAERYLAGLSDGMIFESRYAADVFAKNVGGSDCPSRIIHNGLMPAELDDAVPADGAADFVFVGELRRLKGVDVLLDAMHRLRHGAHPAARLVVVGTGPDGETFKAQSAAAGLTDAIDFAGAMPVREAFERGRCVVMPSRAESLPYVALEAAGAGLPLIATAVGGCPEIVAGTDTALVPAGDAAALAAAMAAYLDDPADARARAARLKRAIATRFSVAAMTDAVLDFYDDTGRPAMTADLAEAGASG